MIERSVLQKLNRLMDDLPVTHHKRMRCCDHHLIGHTRKLCPHDRNLAIVWTRDQQTVDPVYRAIPRDYPYTKGRRPKSVREGVGACSQLLARRAVDEREKPPGAKSVDDFASLVWR